MHELETYRATAAAWAAAHLAPASGPALRSSDVTEEQVVADRALQRQMYEAGYIGITLPVEYGGQGLTKDHERAWREVARGYELPQPGGIAAAVTNTIVLPTLLRFATEEQKRRWVPDILSGAALWVQLLSEPGAGSDLASLLCKATADGDEWVLNGTKVWSSGALHADFGICLARTDWDVPKHQGLTWFAVPLRAEGVTVRPIREINGSSEFCEEFLDDVVVSDADRIGDLGAGWPIANFMLATERGGAGGAGHGGGGGSRFAGDLVELAERRGLLNDGATRQAIARAHVEDWAQAQLTKRSMTAVMSGEADPSIASLIKLGLGIVQPERAAVAMELAGRSAVAWSDENDPGFAASVNFLNGRIMAIAGGSNEIQRNIVSERLLDLPREHAVDKDKAFREVLRDAKSWGKPSAS